MNIYVGNLSYNVRANELQEVLEQYGVVDFCKVIKDIDTGKSKGFAFIEMRDEVAGTKAIDELNGVEFDGRPIVIIDATPKSSEVTELEKAIHFVMLGKLYFSNHQYTSHSTSHSGKLTENGVSNYLKKEQDLFPQWY